MQDILLHIKNLNISLTKNGNKIPLVKNSNFSIQKNEISAIVGESGSGKSLTALAVMGLLQKNVLQIEGSINFEGKELVSLSEKEFQKIRANEIGMIFQEPMSALNPSMRCGKQVVEVIQQHKATSKKDSKQQVLNLFEQVKLPNPERIFKAYPHEISGGQKQRLVIAMAIACQPKLLIADEPTTALDVTVQKEILNLLKDLQKQTGMGLLFISHDLALVSQFADKVIVMYQGDIIEQGNTEAVFQYPKEIYTKALIASRPSTNKRLKTLPTISDFINNSINHKIISSAERKQLHENLYKQPPLLEVIDVEKTFLSKAGWFSKPQVFKAVDGVSFKVYPGETLGLVGESGCGKSTLGNAILQLDKSTAGCILFEGKDITTLSNNELRKLRKDIQLIFQDPYASLNPRLQIGEAIIEPMTVHHIGNSSQERKNKVLSLLERVGLSASDFNKYPHEFSGGQRQRIGIARTIALEPKLIICDESVSALDISVQAQVLNLLNDLKENFGFTYIFISHDLSVVKYMSDQLLVMNKGKIEEIGEADEIYENPKKAYTKTLIDAIPKG